MTAINKSTLQFLKDISEHNDRDWFQANKEKYLIAQENMVDFADALIMEMKKHDDLENDSGKKALYRIYNDVRFGKDRSPYKTHFGIRLKRATKQKRGGYYLHICSGNSFMACGFFAPNKEDLKRIRQDIDWNYAEWNRIMNQKELQKYWGSIFGDSVITAPRGYAIEHPGITLLRHKQFLFRHHFTDTEVLSNHFAKELALIFKTIRPWLDHMSEVLTTDLNGESLL